MATEHCHIVIPYHQPLFVVLTQPPHSILHAQVLGWAPSTQEREGRTPQHAVALTGISSSRLLLVKEVV